MQNKTLQNLQNTIIERITSKEDPAHIIDSLIEDQIKDIQNDFNINILKEDAKLFYKTINESYYPNSIVEREEAFHNTISEFYKDLPSNIYKIFIEFAIYDKIFIENDQKYLFKLYGLLYILQQHDEKLEKYYTLSRTNDVIKKATALSTNPKVQEFITPRINTYKEALAIDSTNSQNKLMLNILLEYKNNPYDIDIALNGVTSYDRSNFININSALLNTLFSSRNLMNSSCSIDDEDIFESIQINIFRRYFKYSFIDQCLGIKKRLSHSKLANFTNEILEHLFDMPDSNLKYTRFNQEIQLKSYFDDLEIYQFRTKRNYQKHPIFE